MRVETIDEENNTAERLRHALVDRLREQGAVRTAGVEAALRAVPRHLFAPTVPLEEAYADEVILTKHDETGRPISAASQPSVVAMMLERLQAEPGRRILEIGAGTGYNAALLAHLTGDDGHVVTIDLDEDIVDGARAALAAVDCRNTRVILGDGALGHPDGAPYDRVIATVGAWDLPPAWLEQLAPDGRLVVPMRLRGSVSRAITFERYAGRWVSQASDICGFVPLRGIADDARQTVRLAPDGAVTLQTHQDQSVDAAAIGNVLEQPSREAWTGVPLSPGESYQWLWLWLGCRMDNALSRMAVERSAIDSGLVRPLFGWGSMAIFGKDDLAYLTQRPVATDSARQAYEIGVIGHGPGAEELIHQATGAIRLWDRDYRHRTAHFEIQPGGDRKESERFEHADGRFVFDRPHNRLIVSWV
ncbi:methyltransferase, FxLD system [Planotetraspora mira]|uniref:methyltransferase, FxLD system n=1 Tax=Planotetraspora mira TaxID=58121 RepID=UPI0019502DA7|nr:methyltransferase, FxLD system [Planotetraspora mira]